MSTPRICVLRAPGTNCDVETAFAFDACGAVSDRVHLFRVLQDPRLLSEYQVLCIPGGFSYGDDIGAGVIFSSQLRGHLAEAIGEFLTADKLVLGICNGFQVLLKAGVLPGGGAAWSSNDAAAASPQDPATLTWNDNGKYTAKWCRLGVVARENVFLRGIDEIELPIAHAEGRLVVRDASQLGEWEQTGQLALRYCEGENPNGSVDDVAGLGDPSGRVLGLMPHPERFIQATQHPQWTRQRLTGEGAGLKMFRNAVEYFG